MLGMSKNRVFGTAKVGDRGQIVIPQEARRFFGISPGDTLLILGNEVSGLVVFMLLTAYDTQKLHQLYAYYSMDSALAEKASVYGALTLYLDFINIFLLVLRLLGMGGRNRD